MILEHLSFHVRPGGQTAFERDWLKLRALLNNNPHCLQVLLQRCVENPTRYIARIEWNSVAGHMESFRGSNDYHEFLQIFVPHVAGEAEMVHFENLTLPQ
ncbi:MAG: antibiotic biosynthesis monooxygenase family protein [Phycisphaerales bacterium]